MKKIILTILAISISFVMISKDSIKISKSNAGTNGYSDVTEKHEDNWLDDFQTHTLTCNNPGSSACAWDYPPTTPAGSTTSIMHEVETLMEAGQLSGSISIGGVTVNWHGEGVSQYEMEITW